MVMTRMSANRGNAVAAATDNDNDNNKNDDGDDDNNTQQKRQRGDNKRTHQGHDVSAARHQ